MKAVISAVAGAAERRAEADISGKTTERFQSASTTLDIHDTARHATSAGNQPGDINRRPSDHAGEIKARMV